MSGLLLTGVLGMGLMTFVPATAQAINSKILSAKSQKGTASFYARDFHGRRTANGETFNMEKLTAAHPTLPFGTFVRVTNLSNGKDVVVRINDRGPYVKGRIIDLSKSAAREIGLLRPGIAEVKVEPLKPVPLSFISS